MTEQTFGNPPVNTLMFKGNVNHNDNVVVLQSLAFFFN